jgi:hypothetical protein
VFGAIGLAIGVVVMRAVVASLMSAGGGHHHEASDTDSQYEAVVVAFDPAQPNMAWAFTTRETMESLDAAFKSGGQQGLGRTFASMMAEGWALVIQPGTRLRVLDQKAKIVRAKVLEGSFAGRELYFPPNMVKAAG